MKYKLFQLVNTYTINISATGNSSDSGNGGGSTVAKYQIDCGLDTQVGGTGWGAGTWGRSTWGSAGRMLPPKTCSYGMKITLVKIYLLNHRDGAIYYWDKSGGVAARAVNLLLLTGSSDVLQ